MRAPFEPGRFRSLYRISHDSFDSEFVEKMATFVKGHHLLAGTTLNARFSGTEGFSIALTRSGVPRLKANFPLFHDFLEMTSPDRANAFFINPLCIAQGAHVAPHVDRSLNTWTRPELPPYPIKVSVLYLDVAEDLEGGTLFLYPPLLAFHRPRITPQTGLLFEFRGDLRHEVKAVEKSSRPRISLVMEQYELPPYLLRKIPEFYVKSSRDFASIMEEAMEIGS
ncbi:MAG: 2OG-Fe(II) oxygenase [Vulcanimicrobiota bacterium]